MIDYEKHYGITKDIQRSVTEEIPKTQMVVFETYVTAFAKRNMCENKSIMIRELEELMIFDWYFTIILNAFTPECITDDVDVEDIKVKIKAGIKSIKDKMINICSSKVEFVVG